MGGRKDCKSDDVDLSKIFWCASNSRVPDPLTNPIHLIVAIMED